MAWFRHVRAALLLVFSIVLTFMALPVADTTVGANYATVEQRDALRDEVGWPAEIVFAGAWLNRNGRDAIVKRLTYLERPLALRFDWNLYPIWSPVWRSVELRVDDALVYRSLDPEYDFEEAAFRERRLAYALQAAAKGRPIVGEKVFALVLGRALAANPEARTVEMTIRAGPFPGTRSKEKYKARAEAPGWEITSWYP